MTKKINFILTITILFTFSICFFNHKPIRAEAQEEDPSIAVKAPVALLMEYSTGQIIYSKNIDEKKYPASMTKMMGLYIILKKIESHEIKYDDIVTVSSNASSMGGSQVFLEAGEQISVNDLFKAICISSANDAIVALGEYSYGSEENFVSEMNKVAKKLGMDNTNFTNPTGFFDENHYTTASDTAKLALALLTEYKDDILKYTSMYEGYIRENTENPFWLVNTNKLVRFYEGMDGLKTGYITESGFNLTATASKNGLRFITVVMGSDSSSSRNSDTVNLMNYGFNTYKLVTLYKQGEQITTYSFKNAKEKDTSIISNEDITYVTKKSEEPSSMNVEIQIDKPDAPIDTNTPIGKIVITNPNTGWKTSFNIYTKNNVDKLKFLDLLLKYWKALIN